MDNNGLNLLDAMAITSFCAQLANMDGDVEREKYYQQVLKAISYEIELLHKENDEIKEQNEKILKILEEGGSKALCN